MSRLCFGTAGLGPLEQRLSPEAGADLLLQAFCLGVTFWDTSDDYGTHEHVACALRQLPRDQVVLATKTSTPAGAVERALAELGTTYLDILFLHGVALDWIEEARNGLRVLRPERESGRVRALGLSTHSAEVARRAVEWPEVGVLLLPFNRIGICLSDLWIEDGGIAVMLVAGQEAAQAGKGVVAMKVYGCGLLAAEGKEALAFVARLPYVHSLCIGMKDVGEVRRNIAWLEGIQGPGQSPPAVDGTC